MTAVLPARPTGAEIKAAPSLRSALLELDSRRARSKQTKIGASEIGECRRRAAYRVARRKPTNKSTGMQAVLGTMLHKGVLAAMRRQYGGLIELKLDSDQVKGSCDYYLEPRVEDLKTTSKGSYEKVLTRGAYEKHWYQVTTYAWLIRSGFIVDKRPALTGLRVGEGLPVDVVSIRYLSRDSGEDMLFERDYDPLFAAEAFLWLADVYAQVEKDGPESVPRDGYGPSVDQMCEWCPFLDLCWGPPIDVEVEADSSRQSRLTVTDEDYINAVADYDRSRKAEADAKREKEFARERLRGRSGPAGELHCAWSGGNELHGVDKDAAVERLIELGEIVPTKIGRSPRQIRVTQNVTSGG